MEYLLALMPSQRQYPNVDKFPSQARKFSVAVGSQVWVEDPDVAWIDGEVLEVKASEIKIRCTTRRTSHMEDASEALIVG
ncbi:hypothetical protein ZIOFF_043548 [Zingiber officinale]|uniref:Myosin N-terminal SH3-like domain-containing protein n=1 Tax=Zingiber officinale TaxID=94328 RepID=A0A8J5GAS8_ZINOF|nr:hypothetical protein ZIOFF_043548 [Zingiber officinale]